MITNRQVSEDLYRILTSVETGHVIGSVEPEINYDDLKLEPDGTLSFTLEGNKVYLMVMR